MPTTRVADRQVARLIGAASLLLLLGASPSTSPAVAGPAMVVAGYQVSGNRILDSRGNPFIVKGVDAVYGRFAGGDPNGYGLHNYQNAPRDLDNLKAQGVNTIRVSVAYGDYAGGPIGQTEYLTELDQVVAWVTQRGMVAEISQGESGFSPSVVNFVGTLAGRYQANPLVWIKPDNEPNCAVYTPRCGDWSYWQTTEQQFVQAIRAAGNTAPIVVNCIWWSWDCSQIASYPLGDGSIIYGAHRYGNSATVFDAAQTSSCDALWGNLAASFPMIVDEVGLFNGAGNASPAAWGAGFLDYTSNWVQARQGSGVIGFNDSWSDSNSMTNLSDGSWNAWGQAFIAHYLSK